MKNRVHPRYGTLLAIVGGVVGLWGILGLIQVGAWGQAGYETRRGGAVVHVEPDGPADAAGLEVGDRIVGVGGARIEDPWLNPSRGRVGVGGVQTLQLDRGGETMVVEVTWGPLAASQIRARVVDTLLVFAFMGFGLWALLSTGTRSAWILALFGLCYGVANFRGPSLGFLEGAVPFVQSHLSLFYTALLFHFLMIYPQRKRILKGRWAIRLAYLPFVLVVAFGLVERTVYPRFLDQYGAMAGLTDLLYMCLALAALVHSWASNSRAERHDSGLFWIPAGLALAIGPVVVLGLVGLAAPGFSLPGEGYLQLLGAAIPGGMALAVVTDARRNPAPGKAA